MTVQELRDRLNQLIDNDDGDREIQILTQRNNCLLSTMRGVYMHSDPEPHDPVYIIEQ